MYSTGRSINERILKLESHLQRENPILLDAVQNFRTLDKVAYRMGLLEQDESYATQIPWWPLISILGTFSAGKSAFINYYLGEQIQRSGNQAVDDKFSVLTYSAESHTLPGVALDADPRFPFYQISTEIEHVAEGEGKRIDTYLQLKTCPSKQLLGKILIDSPGFDADAQRTSTLKITDHIVDLSDLVLVFFDARHPEPGAMRDTLKHLVGDTIHRADSSKFLYILNQLDTTAREDNPEDIVAAWQRAMAEQGLTAGRFYTIYNPDINIPIDNEMLRKRFEKKRDQDLGEIKDRMHQVEIERAYRIVGALEKNARDIQERIVPTIREYLEKWKKNVLIGDAVVYGLLTILFIIMTVNLGYWQGFSFAPPWKEDILTSPLKLYILSGIVAIILTLIHFKVRRFCANRIINRLIKLNAEGLMRGNLALAFQKNTKPWRSIFYKNPAGWGMRSRKVIASTLDNTALFIQRLNDTFTNPSGKSGTPTPPATNPTKNETQPSDHETKGADQSDAIHHTQEPSLQNS